MAVPLRKLFVVGGSGFLGEWTKRSSRRHGPTTPARPADSPATAWQSNVEWVRGDSLRPETYAAHLQSCDAVVHTVGTLLEADYKRLVKAGSLCQAASGLIKSTPTTASVTYETTNRDTALCVADAAAQCPSVRSFVYISATDFLPLIDRRYISTKREAEVALIRHQEFRTLIFRPGFMFSDQQPFTVPLAQALDALGRLKRAAFGLVSRTQPLVASGLGTPPLHIDVVAQAVLRGLLNSKLNGIVGPDGILELSKGFKPEGPLESP
ncbi:hypothetical protein IWQ60_002804 [Tieghemiomyces parasiticus]|uniref:NAD(P)-binding domain-containing protein n=1 Tax=Tieghemiomyces parasiticus TaxID=78921 RepID=A0A9W8AC13_9FUNG|nr:hypothetical protein IWQ60_002804 [Tieghemiomyces parasiticus]